MRKLLVLACVVAGAPAYADIDDDEPWDWERLESYITSRGKSSTCDAVAEDMGIRGLVCTMDHKSWDAHLKKEHKVFKLRDRNHQQPSNCDGGAFYGLRDTSSNGEMPAGVTAQPVRDEFKAKVKALDCRFDDVERDPFLTYDAAKKQLVFHLTRKAMWNADWIVEELRRKPLRNVFPALNKWWDQRR